MAATARIVRLPRALRRATSGASEVSRRKQRKPLPERGICEPRLVATRNGAALPGRQDETRPAAREIGFPCPRGRVRFGLICASN